ncbi:iron-containing alcohol dehydrogenase [Chelativorans sp.]|uniref:iron-containing alcohol dehydrogenase n=1 Tax=Chelativorans sp. TaxID=2203393 RepID=UPI002810F410|nr:iron-containing alcohol dehydrogenase [Chelativorans sp.]
MARIFRAPRFYIQGPDAIGMLGEKAATLGRSISVLCDAAVLEQLRPVLEESLRRQDIVAEIIPFDGDVTLAEMDRLAVEVREGGGEVVVGVGGGRALDTAKGVARRNRLPFISVPTVASTDAPATRGVVIYDAAHRLAAVEQMDDNPAFVIVDTAIIAAAPARFLRGGIGDALSTKFEAEANWAGAGLTKHGARPLLTGRLVADACYRTLVEHGPAAMRVAGTGEVTEDFEYAVEAVLLMSAIGFENTGLSVAHAIATELGTIEDVRSHSLHGEHAAYGTLVQVVAEGRPAAEFLELHGFFGAVSLPRTLAELGLEQPIEAVVLRLAQAAAESPFMENQKAPLAAERLAWAIRALEHGEALDLPAISR